jgi:hypothetical protein
MKYRELDIEDQIKQAAIVHLNAVNAEEALDHFTKDVVAVSNQTFFESYESLAKDVNNYYHILKKVIRAEWYNIQIRVIEQNAATFTAGFDYCFKTVENEKIELSGVWSAVFVKEAGQWKIKLRHESFVQK